MKTKPVRPELDASIQPPVKFSRERVPPLLVDANVTPDTMQYLQRANLSVTDARRVLPEGRTDWQILEFARAHNRLLLTHSWRLIAKSNLDPWLNAGIVILPFPGPGKRVPVSPDDYGELRYALDQLLMDLPYLARQRHNAIYDYRSGLAERVNRIKTRTSRRLEF